MKYAELLAKNLEIPALQEERAAFERTNTPLLEAEEKIVEGKRLSYLLTSYKKTPAQEEELKNNYETALDTYLKNQNDYYIKLAEFDNKIYSIDQQLRKQSDDKADIDEY
ncbi:hypothetical protein [Pseudomonas koreensis]|uniref:Uncharacterized protein n=1 Tax=Pseudomonas koreensis TaxID=198620 RepID=A0AA94ESZ6_9PSED|nr:hypothetical protein [Pseudomonas koreensis]RVD79137.1 hypothetical protein A9HBioS_0782 [Pseudomonas koreensis]